MSSRVFSFFTFLIFFGLTALGLGGCQVDSVCYSEDDCPSGEICDRSTGRCLAGECVVDADCPADFICLDRRCIPSGDEPLDCPAGMVSIEEAYCIDIYEASRPDATAGSAGSDDSYATSRMGVRPWEVRNNQEAQAACEAAGKDLCTEMEWQSACRGPERHVYAYGDRYEAATCNGIDTFCFCDSLACRLRRPCPFPGCFEICSSAYRLLPTGMLPGCTNAYGVFDMNGNLWEHVKGGDETRIRGGAFNCRDSQTLHRCDYIPTLWTPTARGFRCCWRPGGEP